ncbi:hypothetical protein Patl1_34060 [Pistacia atlantica]|uniref:Uncharacterized protein n=1 Tax=Pistacia atlantica TaxID=434234 RepID=A0ACC0ZNY5_9ROSI|nr:hypothetical protein Patl1_34060 [Pistacia atlantica]
MDSRLYEAIANNDRGAFDNLVQDNEGILEQRTDYHLSTVLHLASRFRHFKLVKDIIELHPEIVETVNKKLVDKLADGHLDVVKLMMNQSWLMDFEEDGIDLNALHVAAAMGHTDIVQNILELAMYIVNTTKEIINCCNNKGHTVLEILELSLGNAESKQLKKAVKAAAGKSTELHGCELPLDFGLSYQPEVVPTPSSSVSAKSRKDSGRNPPSGVFQKGSLKGKSTVSRITAFEVFTCWDGRNRVRVSGTCADKTLVEEVEVEGRKKGQRRRATATIQGKAQSQHDRTNAAGAIYSESTISDVDSSISLGYYAY